MLAAMQTRGKERIEKDKPYKKKKKLRQDPSE